MSLGARNGGRPLSAEWENICPPDDRRAPAPGERVVKKFAEKAPSDFAARSLPWAPVNPVDKCAGINSPEEGKGRGQTKECNAPKVHEADSDALCWSGRDLFLLSLGSAWRSHVQVGKLASGRAGERVRACVRAILRRRRISFAARPVCSGRRATRPESRNGVAGRRTSGPEEQQWGRKQSELEELDKMAKFVLVIS